MLRSAVLYFALVFGAGFALGPVRVLWLAPRVGAQAAELIEAPVMLLAIVLAGWWMSRRSRRGERIGVGLIAAGMVLAADVAVGVGLRGMSPAAVFTDRDAVSGAVYYGLLGLFALMPWLLGRPHPAP